MAGPKKVKGLEEALAALKQLDPEVYKATRERIRSDAKPMLQAAKKGIPKVPLSGWGESSGVQQDIKGRKTLRTASGFPVFRPSQAKRGVTLSMRSRRKKGYGGKWLAIAMVQKDAAGMIFDYAKKSTNQNRFPAGLNVRNPKPSRYMWKAADDNMKELRKSIKRAAKDAERAVNKKLR